jgi:YihY family inner membrane protein
VSTATKVPETIELTGDDARKTLLETGRLRLLKASFERLRAADGFSHARSLAFVTSLVLVQGLIALVGLAAVLGEVQLSKEIVGAIQRAVPGPAGEVLTDAVVQARKVGARDLYLPLFLGLLGTMITGTTAVGQIERGFNRLYGVEQDRPAVEKYGRAFVLMLLAGSALAAAFAVFALGRRSELTEGVMQTVWPALRWPVALLVAAVGITALLRYAPRRRQPGWSWLMFGAAVSAFGWALVTFLLGGALRLSSSFGDTYGPLAGLVALQLWALFSAIAILYGAAVAAQLEAVRAGVEEPRGVDAHDAEVLRNETSYAS